MRLNPPPNWPRPKPGWTPPPGWQPPAEWGEPPYGWQLWLPDDSAVVHQALWAQVAEPSDVVSTA